MAMFLGGVPHFQTHPILIYHHQTILESKTLDFFIVFEDCFTVYVDICWLLLMDRVELEWFLMAVDIFNLLYVDMLIVVDAFLL